MQITPPFCSTLTLYIEMGREKMTEMEKTRTNVITNARCLHIQTTCYGQTPPLKNFTQIQYHTVPFLDVSITRQQTYSFKNLLLQLHTIK
jgi:hypothetical protein